jgi:ATP-dependent DNA ligase
MTMTLRDLPLIERKRRLIKLIGRAKRRAKSAKAKPRRWWGGWWAGAWR